MPSAAPIRTDVVLLGAGHAHVEVLRRFALHPEPGLRLTLVSREQETPYSGMLPGLIRGDYDVDQAHIDLAPLAAAARARLILGEAISLDLQARQVGVTGRPALSYDLLSIDVGGGPAIPQDSEGVPVKPIGQLRERLIALAEHLPAGGRVAVIGGGPAGCELALALMRGLRGRARIALISETAEPVDQAPARARRVVRAALVDGGVELISGVRAIGVAAGQLFLSDGSAVEVADTLWATGVNAPPFLAASGLECDAAGCVRVDASLQAVRHPGVFAAGDCATLEEHDLPKAGVWAVRAGRPLAANLRRAARGNALRRWRPPSDALVILGLGDGRAVAWRNGLAVSGRLVWRWKDWIDRRWVGTFRRPMRHVAPPEPAGSEARLGPEVLARVLAALPRPPSADGVVAAGVPGDAAVLLPPAGQAIVQSVDHLRVCIDDPFVFGQIAATQALSRLHAAGARPWSALALPDVPRGSGERMRGDLSAALEGAARVFQAEGCTLAGSHSRDAAELALGFAVTGLADPKRLLRPSGLRLGDALLLTKPLGTGIVLAGHQRGEARTAWLQATVDSMRESNARTAQILRDHGVAACAGVAELGLAGHLLAMLRASHVAAVLWPDAAPALPGAAELKARGVEDRLAADNRRLLGPLGTRPNIALLVDPQISGGLLAGVAGQAVDACLAALATAGIPTAVVGRVVQPAASGAFPLRLDSAGQA